MMDTLVLPQTDEKIGEMTGLTEQTPPVSQMDPAESGSEITQLSPEEKAQQDFIRENLVVFTTPATTELAKNDLKEVIKEYLALYSPQIEDLLTQLSAYLSEYQTNLIKELVIQVDIEASRQNTEALKAFLAELLPEEAQELKGAVNESPALLEALDITEADTDNVLSALQDTGTQEVTNESDQTGTSNETPTSDGVAANTPDVTPIVDSVKLPTTIDTPLNILSGEETDSPTVESGKDQSNKLTGKDWLLFAFAYVKNRRKFQEMINKLAHEKFTEPALRKLGINPIFIEALKNYQYNMSEQLLKLPPRRLKSELSRYDRFQLIDFLEDLDETERVELVTGKHAIHQFNREEQQNIFYKTLKPKDLAYLHLPTTVSS